MSSEIKVKKKEKEFYDEKHLGAKSHLQRMTSPGVLVRLTVLLTGTEKLNTCLAGGGSYLSVYLA